MRPPEFENNRDQGAMDSELFWDERRGTIASVSGGTPTSRAVLCAAIALAARADVVYFPYDVRAPWTRAKPPKRVLVVDVDDEDRAPGRNRRPPPPNALLVTRFAAHASVRIVVDDTGAVATDAASGQRYAFSTSGRPRAPS